jgi:hypothetical protein
MCADNGQSREVAVQIFDIGQKPVFKVEHYRLRRISAYFFPQFIAGVG